MKKVLALMTGLILAAGSFVASAQTFDPDPEVTQISDLQWKLTWLDYKWVNPLNQYDYDDYGNPIEGRTASLVNYDDPTDVTYLFMDVYNTGRGEITFPQSGNFLIINLEKVPLADGDYILTIPAGYLTLNPANGTGWVLNEEFQDVLTIGSKATVEYELNFPKEIENSNNAVFYWTNVASLSPGKTTGAYIVNKDTNVKYDLNYLKNDEYSKANLRISNTYMLTLNLWPSWPGGEVLCPNGTYLFYMPANYVYFNGSKVGNEAIEGVEFTFTGPWSEGKYEINGPDEYGVITINWIDAESISYNPAYQPDGYSDIIGVTIQDWDGDEGNVNVPYPESVVIEGTVMTINIGDLDLYNGLYRLYVPEEFVLVKNDRGEWGTDGVFYTFTYTGGEDQPDDPDTPKYEIYSHEAVWSILPDEDGDYIVSGDNNPIEIWWPGTTIAHIEDPWDEVNLQDSELYGNLTLEWGTEVSISEDGTKLLLDLSNIPAQMYRINVPESYLYVYVDGMTYVNMATSMDDIFVSVDEGGNVGVSSIFDKEDGVYNVFNLNGVKVLETKDASAVKSLAKGLYIVNGKKLMVK